MKKAIISVLLVASMLVSMTGCSYIKYIKKVEEAKKEQAELEEQIKAEQQAIIDAINDASQSSNNDSQDADDASSDSDDASQNSDDESQNSDDEAQSSDEESQNASDSSQSAASEFAVDLNTVDAYGNEVDNSIVSGAKVVMINFWEPWCGPCVGEIPDLELIYEKYKNDGLVIIGAYTSSDMLDDIKYIIESDGLTYPVIEATRDMYQYMSDYVPTTVFFDGEGNVLEDGQYIGSRSYNDWASIVEDALESVE